MPDSSDRASELPARRAGRRIALVLGGWLAYAALLGALPVRAGPIPSNDSGPRGRAVWDRSGCVVCHSLYGLGGHLGPDLTDASTRLGDAALRAIIRHGGRVMPAFFALDAADLDALLAFLAETDASGDFPPSSLATPPFGP